MMSLLHKCSSLLLFTVLIAYSADADPNRVSLKFHNKYRSLHGAPDLQLDNELEVAAQKYANYLAETNARMRPKEGIQFGQNLFEYFSGDDPLPSSEELVETAVDSWYSGIKKYDWREPRTSTFSQLVWRGTRKVGVGVGRRGNRAVVVAMYFPQGNALGQFRDNVLPVGDYPPEVGIQTSTGLTNEDQFRFSSSPSDVNKYYTPSSSSVPSTESPVLPAATAEDPRRRTTTGGTRRTSPTTEGRRTTSQTQRTVSDERRTTSEFLQGSSGGSRPTTAQTQRTTLTEARRTTAAGVNVVGDSAVPSSSSTVTPSGPGVEPSEKEVQILGVDLQNAYRLQHGSPPLRLDDELAKEAQDYAYYLASGKSKRRTVHGQNLFWFSGFTLPPDEAVRKAVAEWYNAKSLYNWKAPLSSPTTANSFSQLVWKSSTKVGIGVAPRRNGNVVVALYSPPGNILSEKMFNENVLPLES